MIRYDALRLKQWLQGIVFLLPSLGGILVFFLLPLGYCALFSFSSTAGRFCFAGLSGYISLFQSEGFRLAFGNTALLLLSFEAALLGIALLAAYLLEDSTGSLCFLIALSVTAGLPPVLTVQFVREFPALWAGMPRLTLLLLYLWRLTGLNCLILKAACLSLPPSLREAAAVDGAGKGWFFRRIQFFHLLPQLKFLFAFDIIGFFQLFRESYLLYGLYPPEKVYLFQNFFFNNFQNLSYQRLSVGSMVTMGFLLAVNLIVWKAGKKHEAV